MVKKIRTTFGIIDPHTKKQYEDIIQAKVIHTLLSMDDLRADRCIVYKDVSYILSTDYNLQKNILESINCRELAVVSLQQRTDMNIAIARSPHARKDKESYYER